MSIEGTWFWNPGDIPADFVHPVVLHADGRAEWTDGSGKVERYVVEGNKLTIGDPTSYHMVFEIDPKDGTWLGGKIYAPWQPEEDDDDFVEGAGPSFHTDAAVLLREPGNLEIVLDTRPVAALEPEEQGPLLV